MKNTYKSHALRRWAMGAAIVSAVFTIYSCTEDVTEGLAQQSVTSSSDATALQGNNGDIIPGKYIVVLKEDEARQRINSRASHGEATRQARAFGQEILRGNGMGNAVIEHAYGNTIAGFSAAMSARDAARLRTDSRVAYIEPDRVIALSQKGKPGGGGGSSTGQKIPWGVNRVGYGNGSGKTAWILDTGIDLSHPDLNTNDSHPDGPRHKSFISTGPETSDPNDYNGHGSHVAGTIGAKANTIGVLGVAENATLIAIKVLDRRGSGSYSGVIAGVDYVASKASSGDVANMSLGGPVSPGLDDAVIAAAERGILFAIAAGNDSKDAINYSPARTGVHINVFTVTAMGEGDKWASFSNFGSKSDNKPIDYCAPGRYIESTWKDGGYNTISGTSMAAPHVAGLLLLNGNNIKTNGYVIGDPDLKLDPIAHK